MTKSKHSKPDEFFKEQLRHLRKELKRKDQEIRQLQKELGYQQNKSPKSARVKDEDPVPNCPACAKGFLSEVEFAGRNYIICPLCSFRKKV